MKALSIRQPWAWLIVQGHKDIENRCWPTTFRGRILVHASKHLTKPDYQACTLFIAGIGPRDWRLPAYDVLKAQCGGIVGEVTIVDCVTESASPWFTGECGFVLKLAKATEFWPLKGALSFFNVPDDRLQFVSKNLLRMTA